MDSKELRIGNYVRASYYLDTEEAKDDLGDDYSEDNEWFIDTVEGICHPAEEFLYWGTCENESGTNRTEGIPLTEQWLIDLGFKLRRLSYLFKINNITSLRLDGNKKFQVVLIQVKDVVYLPKIDYVHQLQNLFYCLTGKELIKRASQ